MGVERFGQTGTEAECAGKCSGESGVGDGVAAFCCGREGVGAEEDFVEA